jgi:hypothetical protein
VHRRSGRELSHKNTANFIVGKDDALPPVAKYWFCEGIFIIDDDDNDDDDDDDRHRHILTDRLTANR